MRTEMLRDYLSRKVLPYQGLAVLNYMVTSNHIHLLAFDNESQAIAKSMQLIAG
jgi:REP element-mobilizing transposase RayT